MLGNGFEGVVARAVSGRHGGTALRIAPGILLQRWDLSTTLRPRDLVKVVLLDLGLHARDEGLIAQVNLLAQRILPEVRSVRALLHKRFVAGSR